jgi:large subunit ribosomal protein L21
MFAIFTTGNKQYKVSPNDIVYTEKLIGNAGDTVEFTEILSIDGVYGEPYIKGAKIIGEIVKQFKAPKILIIKHRSQKHHTKSQGHRQQLTQLKIKDIIK